MDFITQQYLCGQWPREPPQIQRTCMTDKATQTPGVWSDDLEGSTIHKRSASWSSANHREEIAKLCEHLRRSVLAVHRNKESPESPSLSFCSQAQTKLPPASSASMGIPKPAICRVSSNTDSINHELESVFLSSTCRQQEKELLDGRCAPVPSHHTHSTDAQLLINDYHHCSHLFLSSADLPHGTEPITNRPACGEGCDYVNESISLLPPLASSPKPNNSFVFKRVPPEGCEKIKVFEETFSCRSKGFPVFSCPDPNKVSFVPTSSGPFCPVKQPSSSFHPTAEFKQAGEQDSPPSHCFSSYRALLID